VTRTITRRRALAELLAGGGALVLSGCGAAATSQPAADGSTLSSTYHDPHGTGVLHVGPGEPLRARTELLGHPGTRAVATLATLAFVADAHVLDAQSPARVTFLDRLGPPFQSTFRPHETLTAQVLAGALHAVAALRPDAVIQGGDLIDNDQANELALALAVLRGGRARPGSGGPGYVGVQSAADADPFYYRPDLDAPVHRGLLQAATTPFASPGARPVHPVLGDHDILVAGEIAPTAQTQALAVGEQAVWDLPPGLTSGLSIGGARGLGADALSPDGPPGSGLIDAFLARALAAPKVRVRPDARRRQLSAAEAVRRLAAGASITPRAGYLDYGFDLGAHIRVLVLDLARRAGGSGGLVQIGQAAWLSQELAGAGERWVLVVSHQPLASSQGGSEILDLLDAHPRVIAALSGHTHRNRIAPRPTAAGGYWLISTASLIDFPQQSRALRVIATADGGVAIQTWMLDHVLPGPLGTVSRSLAYLDAQGGRPAGLAGTRLDRNVTLYRGPVRA
jgi:3',5'-cyclic AMP phosphodiesterase CpdA